MIRLPQDWSRVLACGLLLLLLPASVAVAADANWQVERRDFLAARMALKKGQLATYQTLRSKLKNYPLRGYLDYDYLRPRLSESPVREIQSFLQQNADSPLSERLRTAWLQTLARRGQWQTFLENYAVGNSTVLQCQYLRARLETSGFDDALTRDTQQLWLVGKSQPDACDPVFDEWYSRGGPSTDIIWERIQLAMENRKLSLASYLGRFLDEGDREWVQRWQRMHRHPARELTAPVYDPDSPIVRKIVLHGVVRLARIDADSGWQAWNERRDAYDFDTDAIEEIESRIALYSAYQRKPAAHRRLAAIDTQHADAKVREWRVRTALNALDWPAVLKSVEAIGETSDSESEQWRYWEARALEQIGRGEEANRIFAALAGARSYHGFLAADRLTLPYVFNEEAVSYSDDELAELQSLPAMQRAHELFTLGLTIDARREWRDAIREFDQRQLELAAVLANRWGWHDRAILTIARANHFNDLELRFPIVYRQEVEGNARRYKIDPAWVFGVLRQESAFMSDARSRAGAMGLMQLMPGTAKRTARLINSPLRRTRELYNADRNIRLGTAHLRRVLDNLQGNHLLATAAYNAGEQRIKQWRPKKAMLPADVWAETIPFTETRNYVKRVLAYTTIFEKRLDRPVTTLSKRMPDVMPAS